VHGQLLFSFASGKSEIFFAPKRKKTDRRIDVVWDREACISRPCHEDQTASLFNLSHDRLSAQPFDGPPSFFTIHNQKSHTLLIDKDRFTLAVPGNAESNILHNILPTYYSSIGLYGLNPENSGHVHNLQIKV
jgi:hypothetical protein